MKTGKTTCAFLSPAGSFYADEEREHLRHSKYTLKTNGLFPAALDVRLQNINVWLHLSLYLNIPSSTVAVS